MDKGYYKKSSAVHLWLHLLLDANHEEKEFLWNGKIIKVKPGQMITGRKALSKETGIHRSSIERILKMLENEHQIEQQKTNKYRLITILNWKKYQERAPNRASSEHQASTNKNDKNNKKYIVASDEPFSLKGEVEKLYESKRRDLNIIGLYFEERKPDIKSIAQFNVALRRHVKAANQLKVFTDDQIIKAMEYAKKEYGSIYTLETLIKILSK